MKVPAKTSAKYKRAITIEKALMEEFQFAEVTGQGASEMTVMFNGAFFVAGYKQSGEYVVLASGWEGR